MKTMKRFFFFSACIVVAISCGSNNSKKAGTLTREQLDDKTFEVYKGNPDYNMILGTWVEDNGTWCFDIRKDVILAFLNKQGSYKFIAVDVINFEKGSNSWIRDIDPAIPVVSLGEFADCGLDVSGQFLQSFFDDENDMWAIKEWGKRYYKDDSIDLPEVTEAEVKAKWAELLGGDDDS